MGTQPNTTRKPTDISLYEGTSAQLTLEAMENPSPSTSFSFVPEQESTVLAEHPGPKGTLLYKKAFKFLPQEPARAIETLKEAYPLLLKAGRKVQAAYAGLALAELLVDQEPEEARTLVNRSLSFLDRDPIHDSKRAQAQRVLAKLQPPHPTTP